MVIQNAPERLQFCSCLILLSAVIFPNELFVHSFLLSKQGRNTLSPRIKVLISYEVTYTISILYSRDADNSTTWISHGFVSHGLLQFVSLVTLCGSYFGFPQWLSSSRSTRSVGDVSSIPGSGRSLEKEIATYSSVLPWEIPWTEEPGGLQSMRSQKRWTQLSD